MLSARNTLQTYGWVSILLHWIMAIALLGMYAVGTYMVELDYYDSLYHTLPNLHKSVGILLGLLLLVRLAWLYSQPHPSPANSIAPAITHVMATWGHATLYVLIVALVITGYLIATAKGHGISVFGWFEVPALLPYSDTQADWAGDIHEFFANLFVFAVGVHALAAFIHHFYWKDQTLKRMLGKA